MATFTRALLSGSTSGAPVKIAATATAGTLVHTAVAGAAAWDEVYIWLTNTDTVARTVTVEWGGATDPDNLVCKAMTLPPSSGPIPVITGLVLNGGLTVRIFASAANVILATGYVNNIA